MQKCPCSMTGLEILQMNVAVQKPLKSLLVIDTGSGWNVTKYGPDAAGLGTDHITLQSALEAVEHALVNLRRQSNVETVGGVVVTDPAEVARVLSGK